MEQLAEEIRNFFADILEKNPDFTGSVQFNFSNGNIGNVNVKTTRQWQQILLDNDIDNQ